MKPGRRAVACTRPETCGVEGETVPGPDPLIPPQVPQLGRCGQYRLLLGGQTVGSAEMTSVKFRVQRRCPGEGRWYCSWGTEGTRAQRAGLLAGITL